MHFGLVRCYEAIQWVGWQVRMQSVARRSAQVTSGFPVPDGATDKPAVAIDLFCGAGGMSLGFEAAGFDILLAVDNNPIHVATHEWNFPLTHSLCADISGLSAEDVLTLAKSRWVARYRKHCWPNDIDCVFGGPSCQGFSEIGRRNPADERNDLIRGFAQLVVQIRPKYFVMENVPGLLAPVNKALLEDALGIFASAGYRLTSDGPLILSAADFGVPQARRRVFVIGSRSDMAPVPSPTAGNSRISVADALNDLRCLERYTTRRFAESLVMLPATLDRLERVATAYVQSLRSGPDRAHGSFGFGYERPWDRTVMTSCGRTIHRDDVTERFRRTPQGAEELISRLPRLRSDGLAPTLRAGTGRDHGSFTSARPIHHIYPRVITVREAARLHSFPDWFRFHTTKWHGFQQIGNSVPPSLARAVAETVVGALGFAPAKLCPEPISREDKALTLSLVEAARYYDVDPETLPKESRPARKS